MKVVALFGAHADDIELGAGGTCAKLVEAGYEVHVVVATDEVDDTVAAARREEAIAAARILGVQQDRIHFLGFADGHVRCDRVSVTRVRELFRERSIRPSVILTHTEADSHQDHVELTRIVKGTFRQSAILKYIVRNSAIVSSFRPLAYSVIDPFVGTKSAALCQHRSQMAVGRVSPEVQLAFSARYGFSFDGHHFEVFEIEIQEGASDFEHVLDCINDAPLSRLWLPLCADRGVGVYSPANGATAQSPSQHPLEQGAPGELQLVTRLQTELSRLLQGLAMARSAPVLRVEQPDGRSLQTLPEGTHLILGGPSVNPLAAQLLEPKMAFAFGFGALPDDHGGHPIIDRRSGRVFEPSYRRRGTGGSELVHDFGLITIVRQQARCDRGCGTIVISAAGIHRAGFAAAMDCLTRMESIAQIVEGARSVTRGEAGVAQWLVPCDGSGQPMLSKIRGTLGGARDTMAIVEPVRPFRPQAIAV